MPDDQDRAGARAHRQNGSVSSTGCTTARRAAMRPSRMRPRRWCFTTSAARDLALHLATYGARRNEDGTYSWKFDPYQRASAPHRLWPDDHVALWSRITCPTLLLNAGESFLAGARAAGLERYFSKARVETIAGAGHWLQHDKPQEVSGEIRGFSGSAEDAAASSTSPHAPTSRDDPDGSFRRRHAPRRRAIDRKARAPEPDMRASLTPVESRKASSTSPITGSIRSAGASRSLGTVSRSRSNRQSIRPAPARPELEDGGGADQELAVAQAQLP